MKHRSGNLTIADLEEPLNERISLIAGLFEQEIDEYYDQVEDKVKEKDKEKRKIKK